MRPTRVAVSPPACGTSLAEGSRRRHPRRAVCRDAPPKRPCHLTRDVPNARTSATKSENSRGKMREARKDSDFA